VTPSCCCCCLGLIFLGVLKAAAVAAAGSLPRIAAYDIPGFQPLGLPRPVLVPTGVADDSRRGGAGRGTAVSATAVVDATAFVEGTGVCVVESDGVWNRSEGEGTDFWATTMMVDSWEGLADNCPDIAGRMPGHCGGRTGVSFRMLLELPSCGGGTGVSFRMLLERPGFGGTTGVIFRSGLS
jgi:hypothetical protein